MFNFKFNQLNLQEVHNLNSFDYTKYPRKLNLGCGFDIKEDYLNIDLNDFHSPDLVADICNLNMLPPNYYEEIIAYDVLEHLTRNKTHIALAEWNRLLKMGGKLKLQVPNLMGLMSLFLKLEYQSLESQHILLRCLFGSQKYDGDFHYNCFTQKTLDGYLHDSGFSITKLKTKDDWLFIVNARKTKDADLGKLLPLLLSIKNYDKFLQTVYLSLLGRLPDKNGYTHHMNKLKSGEMNQLDIIINFLECDERTQLTFSPYILGELLFIKDLNDFLNLTYDVLLKRKPDLAGFNNYLYKLKTGELTKMDVLVEILECDERKNIVNCNY